MNKYVLLQGIAMPLLSQISNTSTIYANAVTATVPGFNDIRSKVNEILVNGYGYTNLMSVNVVAGELINSKQWNDVVTDFQKIYVHLNDTLALFTTIPATNDLITETFVEELISKINVADVTMSYRPPVGQRSSTSNSSTRTATWGSSAEHIIEHTIDYTWLSNQDATYFFNLGGRISFALTSSNGTGSTSTYWANLISTANSALGATSYDHSSYSTSKILYNNGTIVVSVNKISGTQFRANVKLDPLLDFNDINLDITSAITYEYSSGAIDAPRPQISETRVLTTSTSVAPPIDYTPKLSIFSPDATPFVFSLRAGSTSTSETIVINNIGFTATTVTGIEPAANSYITPKFTYNSGWTLNTLTGKYETVVPISGSRTFTLDYTGNTVGTYNSRFSVTVPAIANGSIGTGTTVVVSPKLFDFSISPSSVTASTTSSSVLEQKFNIVPSNGTYTISTMCTGSSATSVLYVSSTASINVNDVVYGLSNLTTSTSPIIQSIGEKIVTINNTLSSTITNAQSIVITRPIVFNLPTQEGYRIIQRDYTGPTVQFSTGTNGTFTTTLFVTVTGTNSISEATTVTQSVVITVTRDAPLTRNIGTWTSALQLFNGVIGASYDEIDGKKYITLGFGMGADGSYSLGNDPASWTLMNTSTRYLSINTVTNININTLTNIMVDSKYALNNPPLYAGNNDSAYTPFLKSIDNTGGYGVWIRPSAYQDAEGGRYGPINIYVERTYKFITTTAGSHTWTIASDNESYFTIDGGLVGDLRDVGRDQSYKQEYTGGIYLEAGEHTLTFYVINTNAPAAIALRIVDPTSLEVWSTRFPVRSKIDNIPSSEYPYKNWQEVYRIPLTGTAQSYQCNDTYCIKNSNNVNGKRWGYYFGDAGTTANSMFTVTDDGSGNITIALNPVNVNSAEILALDSNDRTTIVDSTHLFYYYSNIRTNNQYTQLTSAPATDGTTQYFIGFTQSGEVRTNDVIPPTDPTDTVVPPIDGGKYVERFNTEER